MLLTFRVQIFQGKEKNKERCLYRYRKGEMLPCLSTAVIIAHIYAVMRVKQRRRTKEYFIGKACKGGSRGWKKGEGCG